MSSVDHRPPEFWVPSEKMSLLIHNLVDEPLQQYSNNPSISSEITLSQKIAMASNYLIPEPDYNCGIYRAEQAVKKGAGNCIAYAEITSFILHMFNLQSATAWKTVDGQEGHAISLWNSHGRILQVDGYSISGQEWQARHQHKGKIYRLAKLAIISSSALIINHADSSGYHIATSRTTTNDYQILDRNTEKTILMPPQKAINYFSQRAQTKATSNDLW
ncbi:hypothetical protein KDA11_03200 [Candidatus Saccharibacteria bacterium]|nr:hypothetical protein [Candidatus Saccharibacteria bacterium]